MSAVGKKTVGPGRFIALEGGEGAGKSTQARLLAQALRGAGREVVLTREPGGTPGAEAIRALLLNTDGEGWGARAEALLFAAARADHVERLILPALAAGSWVICDRFLDSSRAYQGGGGGLSDADILALHQIGSEGLLPDVTLLIEVSPQVATARLALRDTGGTDRIGGREAAYHARVAAAFAKLAQGDPARFARIAGDDAPDAIHARILAALAPLFGPNRRMMLVGHEEPWREWRAALQSDRMHHAWILAGPQGLGKGAFARAAAAELVAEQGVAQPRPEAHPDIIIPEHPPENKEEVKKREAGEAFTTKRSIPIDEIRAMQHRLTTRPSMGSRRAVIIDPADDMEKGAVNALLKSLEEPPTGTYFLLVTHRPGRLLPTVRSRCRVLRFAPLAAPEIDRILIDTVPQADAATRAAAIAAANGSPGAAMGFVEEKLGAVHQVMRQILAEGDASLALRGRLSAELGARPARTRLAAVLELARAVLAAELRGGSTARQARIIPAHAAMTRLSAEAPTYNFDAGLLAMEIGALLAGVAGAGTSA